MGEPGPLKGSWEFPMSLILLPVIGGPRTARFTLLAELTYPAPSFPSAPRGAPSGDRRANGGTQPLSVGRPPSILSCPQPPEFLVHCSAPCLPPPSFLE